MQKKKTRIRTTALVLGLVALMTVSCEKQKAGSREKVNISITGTTGESRTSLSGESVLWNKGDGVSVFDGSSNNLFTTQDEGSSAVFRGQAAPSGSYTVLYPYSSEATVSNGIISTSLPSVQTATAGSFSEGANLSAGIAVADNGSWSTVMRNIGCCLKFSVGSSASGISKVTVTAIGGEILSGPVEITFGGDGIPTASGSDGSVSSASIIPSGESIAEGIYYLVLRPTALSKGIRITITKGMQSTDYDFPALTSMARGVIYTVSGDIDSASFSISNEHIAQEITPWSGWTDAESVKACLLKARDNRKVYFSQFKFYNYETTGDLTPYKSLGYPLMYSLDFYKGSGEYYPEAERAQKRANTLSIVKKAWKKNRAIPSMSWHLESPYAIYNDFCLRQGQSMGCRYLDQSKVGSGENVWCDNFPAEHRFQVREILNNEEVDYVQSYTNPNTGLVERVERHFKVGDWFDDRCREVAGIINEFVDDEGNPIPVIFRLWHELEDRWAWWQLYYYNSTRQNCSIAEYKALWQRTVNNFRTMCPNAELLFVYCHDRNFSNEETYMYAYPGDDYVDIMGYDDYYIGQSNKFSNDYQATVDAMLTRSRIVSKLAREHGKISMICETNNGSDDTALQSVYFTDYVQKMLSDEQTTLSIFQIWSAPGNSTAKLNALSAFINKDNVIFEY